MEVEAAIEAIADSSDVAFGVLAEAEGMMGTAEAGFDIAQDRVFTQSCPVLIALAGIVLYWAVSAASWLALARWHESELPASE